MAQLAAAGAAATLAANVAANAQVFHGEWDSEGVYVYQAFNDAIADWALDHQRFGGPDFNVNRMTWVKPSFAWVLYRSGYGHKHNQNRVLKVKLPHDAAALLLTRCDCGHSGGGSNGRVQWDPARDLLEADGKEPRRMLRRRAIQIGLKGSLSEQYVASTLSIEDVTPLAHKVGTAHGVKAKKVSAEMMAALAAELPNERTYTPACTPATLTRLGMLPGDTAQFVSRFGLGKASCAR
jgi:hypothetical protein